MKNEDFGVKVYYNPETNQIATGMHYIFNNNPFYLCFVLEIDTGYLDVTETWLDGWEFLGNL